MVNQDSPEIDAWMLAEPTRYEVPRPYIHPQYLIGTPGGNGHQADEDNIASEAEVTSNEIVTTLARNGEAGYAGSKGLAARFTEPNDVAIHGVRCIIATYVSICTRKITPHGTVTTWARSGQSR